MTDQQRQVTQDVQVSKQTMEKGRLSGELMAAAFAASLFAALLTNISIEARSPHLQISLGLLSAAAPMMIATWYSFRPLVGPWAPVRNWLASIPFFIGYLGGFAGFLLMLLHFSTLAAAIFLFFSVTATGFVVASEFRAFLARGNNGLTHVPATEKESLVRRKGEDD